MTIRLTILSALQVLALVAALVAYLQRIVQGLERIGGAPTSYLAKVSFGVRAIEKETSHLAPQVTQLNQGLTTLGAKLSVVDEHLRSTATALTADAPERAKEPA